MKTLSRKVLLFICLISAMPSVSALTITLDSCLVWAALHYPQTKQFELMAYAEAYDLKNAEMVYTPQISAAGKMSYQSDVIAFPFAFPPALGIQMPEFDKLQYQVGLELTQSIWDGGQNAARKKQIRATAEFDKQQLVVDLYHLRKQVQQIYFGVLLLRGQLDQADIYSKTLQTNLERVQALERSGMANASDVDLVLVEQVSNEQAITELRSAHEAYVAILAMMIGKPIDKGDMFVMPDDQWEQISEVRRPELDRIEAQKAQLQAKLSSLFATGMPKIQLFVNGSYGYPGLNLFNESPSFFAIGGLRLQWNLSGLYTNPIEKRKLQVMNQSIDVQKETFEFQTNITARQQRMEIEKYQRLLVQDEQVISLRSQIRKATEVKYQNGTVSMTDLLNDVRAEQLAVQARHLHQMRYLMAIHDLRYTYNQ